MYRPRRINVSDDARIEAASEHGARYAELYANKKTTLRTRAGIYIGMYGAVGAMAGWAGAQILSAYLSGHMNPAITEQRQALQEARERAAVVERYVGPACAAAIKPYVDAAASESQAKERPIWAKPEQVTGMIDKDLCNTVIVDRTDNIAGVVKANNDVINQQYYLNERLEEQAEIAPGSDYSNTVSAFYAFGGLIMAGGSTGLYARYVGMLKPLHVDIVDRVKPGPL